MKPIAITAAAIVAAAGIYLIVKELQKHPPVDEAFAAKWSEHIKAVGIEPSKHAFHDGGLSVYSLTPPVDGGVYVIEAFYAPGSTQCWARVHDTGGPVDSPHPREVATAQYTDGSTVVSRTHKNCTEAVANKLFEYFDGIHTAVKQTVAGK